MGKKNRNRGSSRGRYDDMFDYAGGNDEDYQYSYQDEIDSAEFVDVENSQKDSRSKETMPPSEKKSKSLASEERESWDFIKAKMDQSLSKLGGSSTSTKKSERTEKNSADSSKEKKEKKPKGPNPVLVFFGKVKSFFSASFQKIGAACKRKPKPEGEENKTAKSSKEEAQKKPGVTSRTFSFLKKKTETLTDAVKATRQKNESQNSSGESAASKDSKPTVETLLRKRRRTYLIIGSLTMSILVLFLTAGILFLVNRSSKPGKPVAQNTETAEQTETSTENSQNDDFSLPGITSASNSNSMEAEKADAPPALDSDLGLPDLIDEPANDLLPASDTNSKTDKKAEKKSENKKSKKEDKTGKTENEVPTVDDLAADLTVGDVVNSDSEDLKSTDPLDSLNSLVNESETKPAEEKDPAKTQKKEEKSEDLLAELNSLPELDASGNTSEKAPESGDLSDLASLTDSPPETAPSEAKDSGNATLQEETPSLNETASQETGEKDSSTESTPSLLDLPESVTPGSASVSPTLSRSEDQNQLPEEMGTPNGVTPGSNIDSWNTPETAEKPAANEDSTAALDLPSDPLAEISQTKEPKSEDPGFNLDLDENSSTKKEEKKSGTDDLGDLGQLDGLGDVSPAQASTFDSDLGSGNDLTPPAASKGQKGVKYTNYTTLKDDSFWKISEKFYQTPAYEKALSRYNIDVVPDPSNLKEGTVLQIPDVNFLRSCYPTLCPQPLQVVQVPDSQNSDQTRGVQYYCAVEGDTLSLIAERLLGDASLWPKIYRLNADKIKEMDLVPAGVKLLIPADETIPEQNIWQ